MNRYGVPRIAFVNKMDRAGANFMRCVDRSARGCAPTRCRSSCRSAPRTTFEGVVDLVSMKAIYWDMETQGMKFEYREIPEALRAAGRGIPRTR